MEEKPIDSTVENNEKTKPVAGFNVHPENINRNGRPKKGYSITEIIKDMMDEQPDIKRALGQKIIKLALEGDLTAIKLVWNYLDGMPLTRAELTGAEGADLIPSIIGHIEKTKYDELVKRAAEDPDGLGKVTGQVVANEQPVQDQGQTGQSSNIPTEPNTTATPDTTGQPQV